MRIGVIRYWPNQPAAEHETIERLKNSAKLLGHEIVELRADSSPLSEYSDEPDFILNLHFASAKSRDILTYGALWNPIAFYEGWGFSQTVANQVSHDFLISCGSILIDDFFSGPSLPEIVPFRLSHTMLPNQFMPQKRTDRKLFYIGVNWEKTSNKRGRHHELLKALDDENMIQIYGPERIGKVKPWGGFKNFKGELPFDGAAVINKINELGCALVISSKQHKEDNIMTSRLFEGVTAAAAIITDNHPFFQTNFQNEVYKFDDKASVESQVLQIKYFLKQMNARPDETLQKIMTSQKIMEQDFNLAKQIDNLARHAMQVRSISAEEESKQNDVSVTAITFVSENDSVTFKHLNSLSKVGFSKIVVITNQELKSENKFEIIKLSENSNFDDFLKAALSIDIFSEYVSYFGGREVLYFNYLKSLSKVNIQDDLIGVLTTGAKKINSGDYYAYAMNANNYEWHNLVNANIIFRTSFVKHHKTHFGNLNLHCAIFKISSVLMKEGLLKLDHLTRFEIDTECKTLGELTGSGFHSELNKLRNKPQMSTSVFWDVARLELLLDSERISGVIDFNSLLKLVYHRLNLPNWTKQLIKKIALRVLKL